MNLEEVTKPALIVAPDGWVEGVYKPGDHAEWAVGATKRYSELGLAVFSSDDRMWRLERFIIKDRPSLFQTIWSWITIGIPPMATVVVELREEEGNATEILLSALHLALSKDCDVLTQFSSKEEIIKALQGATGVKDVIRRLQKTHTIQ